MDTFYIKIGVFPVCPSLAEGEGAVLFPKEVGRIRKFSAYSTSSLVWILGSLALSNPGETDIHSGKG